MSTQTYIAECSFCGNGLLRFIQCQDCQEIAAMCDECELMWSDIAAVSADPESESASAFPACPNCETELAEWDQPSATAISEADLAVYVAGMSEQPGLMPL